MARERGGRKKELVFLFHFFMGKKCWKKSLSPSLSYPRLHGLRSNNPRRHRRRPVLAVERSQRDHLPRLHVPRAPVVQQTKTENSIRRVSEADGLSQGVTRPSEDGSYFQFEVDGFGGTEDALGELAAWPADFGAGDDDGGAPAFEESFYFIFWVGGVCGGGGWGKQRVCFSLCIFSTSRPRKTRKTKKTLSSP